MRMLSQIVDRHFLLAAALFTLTGCASTLTHHPSIALDGTFHEWAALEPSLQDPADAPDADVDFSVVKITSDVRFVHLLIDCGRTVNLQGLNGTVHLLLDVDGRAETGEARAGLAGVDIDLQLSTRDRRNDQRYTRGVGLQSTTYDVDLDDPDAQPVNPYDIGFAFAPTYASERFELRIERGTTLPNTAPLFTGQSFRGKLVYVDEFSQQRDETAAFEHTLPVWNADAAQLQPTAALPERTGDKSLRIVSWNIERGAILDEPEIFQPIIAALRPDVLLLQEFPHNATAEDLQRFFDDTLPASSDQDRWHVAVGRGGGDLRSVIVSRFPIEDAASMWRIAFPDNPNRTVRSASSIININGWNLLATSLHLKCCGSLGSHEDQTRLTEVRTLNAALIEALDQHDVDAIVIGGDFNLVGSRMPLTILETATRDKPPLRTANPMQLDDLTNATWADRDQPFAPGRLDYVLVNRYALDREEFQPGPQVLRSFVLDTADLAEDHRRKLGIAAEATQLASDHLPIVVDLLLPEDARQ